LAKELIPDELWKMIEPILPPPKERRYRYPGRKPMDRRKALTGIVFVLRSGIPWEMLPKELGCGSGMSCWRYLRDWQKAGVWQEIHELMLAKLNGADKIDWWRAIADSSSVRAVLGGRKSVRIPRTDGKREASIT
jgi:transposase